MKHYNNSEIKEMLYNIKNGIVYCGVYNGYGIGKICEHNGYISWRHFGQSANKMTINDMRFVLETIFNDCECVTPAKWSDYHIGYIPIDKKYKGIDYSTKHPNVCGK